MKVRAFNDESNSFVSAKLIELENMEIIDERGFDLSWFTGLKDKNGVEIYEGDIVDYASGVWVDFVEFSEGNIWIASEGAFTSTDLNMNCISVIGNIYQNPELIENNN